MDAPLLILKTKRYKLIFIKKIVSQNLSVRDTGNTSKKLPRKFKPKPAGKAKAASI
jgi:hypothetical protein